MNGYKNKLHRDAIARNLVTMPPDEQKKLIEGLKDIPTQKMLEQAQYLENVLLPKIAQNRGEDSKDYKFYSDIRDSLLWAIFMFDRIDYMWKELDSERIMNDFLREKILVTRKELEKYQLAEDMLMNETYNRYAKAIASKAATKLSGK